MVFRDELMKAILTCGVDCHCFTDALPHGGLLQLAGPRRDFDAAPLCKPCVVARHEADYGRLYGRHGHRSQLARERPSCDAFVFCKSVH